MTLNLNHEFYDLDQQPITLSNSEKPATAHQIFEMALKTVGQKEQLAMSNSEALHRRDLIIKMRNNREFTHFTADDVALLRKCIEGKFIPLVVAQCCDILDGKTPTN